MAEVFLAKQVGIGGFEKPVALKRIQRKLLESRDLAIDMFLNEAKIAGRTAKAASTASGVSMRVRPGASRVTAADRSSSAYVRAACR